MYNMSYIEVPPRVISSKEWLKQLALLFKIKSAYPLCRFMINDICGKSISDDYQSIVLGNNIDQINVKYMSMSRKHGWWSYSIPLTR